MTNERSMNLHFGALCNPIIEQLKDQRYILSESDSDRFQMLADAITTLHLHHIISDSITYKAHQKLMKQISERIHV
jgi:hypothetical protein